MNSNILEITNLNHTYDADTLILQDINLDISKGERVAILGPSGCGKSTLLRLIAGLEKQKTGLIKINNSEVSSENTFLPPEKRKVGLVVQEKALFPHLTVQQNICFGIQDKRDKDLIAQSLMRLLKIDSLKNKYPHEISGGEQQRVALARSMAPNPSLLMLDEPFSALDVDLKNNLYEEISNLFSERNITVLLVTHDLREAEIMTTRQLKMEKGKLI
tara:strand:- start:7484 stop:8134 length:651 start_codon:yes stop_codon:yes gene_type:complete